MNCAIPWFGRFAACPRGVPDEAPVVWPSVVMFSRIGVPRGQDDKSKLEYRSDLFVLNRRGRDEEVPEELEDEFGEPWEIAADVNWWLFQRREVRLNLEYIYDYRSPIGCTAVPQTVGGTGSIFNANLELSF